jgi:hypothetical protein
MIAYGSPDKPWWGRVIFYVADVDVVYINAHDIVAALDQRFATVLGCSRGEPRRMFSSVMP